VMPPTPMRAEINCMNTQHDVLLEVKGLKTYFFLHEGVVRAVDDVSFDIRRSQTLGIIGESGCGKSVTAQSILRIVPAPPGRVVGGDILLHQRDAGGGATTVNLAKIDPRGAAIRRIRGKTISMIFQEPMTSFGPLHTIGNQIVEAILIHQKDMNKRSARARAIELLGRVGIPRPDQQIDSYPHQLSGGMRQRAMIAMALSCNPDLLIADEPTTALDVTIQAQILDLLRQLQAEFGMAIMFITHDLGVIAEIADDVAVMYLGKIVEQASVRDLFARPQHPYTQALLKSIPKIDSKKSRRLPAIQGVVPDPYDVPAGCAFSDRCASFMPGMCDQAVPALLHVERDHLARCYLYSDRAEGQLKNNIPLLEMRD
jgi:peptide/nickel transport system ATP-binding protein